VCCPPLGTHKNPGGIRRRVDRGARVVRTTGGVDPVVAISVGAPVLRRARSAHPARSTSPPSARWVRPFALQASFSAHSRESPRRFGGGTPCGGDFLSGMAQGVPDLFRRRVLDTPPTDRRRRVASDSAFPPSYTAQLHFGPVTRPGPSYCGCGARCRFPDRHCGRTTSEVALGSMWYRYDGVTSDD